MRLFCTAAFLAASVTLIQAACGANVAPTHVVDPRSAAAAPVLTTRDWVVTQTGSTRVYRRTPPPRRSQTAVVGKTAEYDSFADLAWAILFLP